jgi:hypothetical protein
LKWVLGKQRERPRHMLGPAASQFDEASYPRTVDSSRVAKLGEAREVEHEAKRAELTEHLSAAAVAEMLEVPNVAAERAQVAAGDGPGQEW